MKTILVDDEPWGMRRFAQECEESPIFEIVGVFQQATEALDYAKNNPVDFALLDIQMPQMDGITLGKHLREIHPAMIIVFVTAYSQYVLEALKLKADYYVLKPYTKEDVEDALTRAKLLHKRQEKPIFMRTFGRFEVFVNGEPIYFSSAKAKELLAILVDKRGGILTSEEALSLMWEDKPHNDSSLSMCRHVATQLRKTLKEHKIEQILVEQRSGRWLNMDLFDCDYYLFLQGDPQERKSFVGEYLSQYSWGEVTLSALERMEKRS